MITGLHHLTATVDQARPDLDFYVGLLGLRLVKKTVNFDNHFVYHFYYGDGLGHPSTIMTTFPYHGWGVAPGVRGAGQVTVTNFSVPGGSLPFWRDRLSAAGVATQPGADRFGAQSIRCSDPSGLIIELRAEPADPRQPWTGEAIPGEVAIRGLASPILSVRRPEETTDFLKSTLGFRLEAKEPGRYLMAAGAGGPGHRLEVHAADEAPDGVNGIGTVHHVALAIATGHEQAALRDQLVASGRAVTRVLDRNYFQSIYFREPGGVLLEVATTGPGFAVDEDPDRLGTALKLPAWEEENRPEIERRLPPI